MDLVARKATGVEGWKMTLVYLPRESGSEVKVDLPNAASTADVLDVVDPRTGSLAAAGVPPGIIRVTVVR